MPLDLFGAPSTQMSGDFEIIPKGTLAWAVIALEPNDGGSFEFSGKAHPENRYISMEVTIVDGPFKGRKIWDRLGIAGSDKYVQAGYAGIKHILEVGRGASPQNRAAYVMPDLPSGRPDWRVLDNLKVAIRVGFEAGKNDFKDKNTCIYLSPNPDSETHKDFARLLAGDTAPPAATAQPAASPAPQKSVSTPSWGSPPAAVVPATPQVAPQAAANPLAASPWLQTKPA
jgi:hypothetical protein